MHTTQLLYSTLLSPPHPGPPAIQQRRPAEGGPPGRAGRAWEQEEDGAPAPAAPAAAPTAAAA